MPTSLKAASIGVLALAALFTYFFFTAKHDPALAAASPFANDPYDAVGSAGFQLALFAALSALARAFRPGARQPITVLRGGAVSILAMEVTLLGDLIALGRNAGQWPSAPGRPVLAALTGGLALVGLLAGGLWLWLARRAGAHIWGRWPVRAPVVFGAGLLTLGLYPPDWGRTLPGALFTAAGGLALLPLMTWAAAAGLFPAGDGVMEDALDDVAAIYGWFKGRAGSFARLGRLAERALAAIGGPAHWGWLNPRRHPWTPVVLFALAAGLLLAAVQIIGEGVRPGSSAFGLVALVFIGGEGLAVLLCYLLFAGYLAIVRAGARRPRSEV
jgi:hypothetical protein